MPSVTFKLKKNAGVSLSSVSLNLAFMLVGSDGAHRRSLRAERGFRGRRDRRRSPSARNGATPAIRRRRAPRCCRTATSRTWKCRFSRKQSSSQWVELQRRDDRAAAADAVAPTCSRPRLCSRHLRPLAVSARSPARAPRRGRDRRLQRHRRRHLLRAGHRGADGAGRAARSCWVWLVGGALAFAGAMAYAELAALRPRAGGEYVYLREAFGPLAAFLTGWTSFVAGFSGAIAASARGARRLRRAGSCRPPPTRRRF